MTKSLDPGALAFATELGPASVTWVESEAGRAAVSERCNAGATVHDAVLGAIHGDGIENTELAGEFLNHFLPGLIRAGGRELGTSLRNHAESHDVAISVLGNLWPQLRNLEFEGRHAFAALLRKRAQWKVRDYRRAQLAERRREDLRVDMEEHALVAHGQLPATDEEDRRVLMWLLLKLRPRDRELLTLELHGHGVHHIASIMRLSEAATRQALARARRRASELIADDGHC